MKAKKEWFRSRNGLAEIVDYDGYSGWYAQPEKDWPKKEQKSLYRVRVTDARELTAQQAVQRVLQSLRLAKWGIEFSGDEIAYHAARAGMIATIRNGKVTVRKIKGENND